MVHSTELNSDAPMVGREGRCRILALLREKGVLSRAALAAATGLTRPTVSAMVAELIDAGLVCELGKGKSNGGKRPILLALDTERIQVIGIDLGEDFVIRGIRCNLAGESREELELPYEKNYLSILEVSAELIRRLSAGLAPETIRGIGIAISATLNRDNEIVESQAFDLAGRPLRRDLEAMTGFAVRLETRAPAAALAESLYGSGREFGSMVLLTSGRGIGAGVIIDGKPFRGSHGAAGELGEMRLRQPGDPADAAAIPTLESRLRTEELISAASTLKKRPLTFSEMRSLLNYGDPELVALVRQAAAVLADGVGLIVGLFDPEAVVIGGQLAELGDPFFAELRTRLRPLTDDSRYSRAIEIRASRLGEFGVALGGATVFLEQIFALEA